MKSNSHSSSVVKSPSKTPLSKKSFPVFCGPMRTMDSMVCRQSRDREMAVLCFIENDLLFTPCVRTTYNPNIARPLVHSIIFTACFLPLAALFFDCLLTHSYSPSSWKNVTLSHIHVVSEPHQDDDFILLLPAMKKTNLISTSTLFSLWRCSGRISQTNNFNFFRSFC